MRPLAIIKDEQASSPFHSHMPRCFISYRHISPDQELAQALGDSLTRHGHSVFLDTKLEVGTRWVQRIEQEVKAAQFFVILLSEHSIQSDMVREEVALAHREKLAILPVRVAFTALLPYDLGAYLNPFQHAHWHTGEPFDLICAQIIAAVNQRVSPDESLSATHFDPASLDRLTRDLAAFVGPVAGVLVKRGAKRSPSWEQLLDTLSKEIPAGPERNNFLAKRSSG